MADLRRLDGTALDPEKLKRNEGIAELLAYLNTLNEGGALAALAFVYVTPEGAFDSCWRWPVKKEGFPWGLTLQGAVFQLQHELAASAKVVPSSADHINDPEPA